MDEASAMRFWRIASVIPLSIYLPKQGDQMMPEFPPLLLLPSIIGGC